MSLHQKIVWLFISVAILPLLIFAALAREQALALADFAAEAELVTEVSAAGRSLAREAAAARSALRSLASLPRDQLTASFLDDVLRSGAGPQPLGFQYMELRDTTGQVVATAGDDSEPDTCWAGRRSALIPVSVAMVSAAGWELVGGYWAGRDQGLTAGNAFWVFDASGRVVVSSSCDPPPAIPLARLPADSVAGIIPMAGGPAVERDVAFARLDAQGWIAVATGTSLLRGPLARFFRNYWLLVLALAATAILAFSMLLRRATGALAELTRAVERVAGGDMRPWLPAPGDDEIGRLTLAFSDMTDRLRETVDQVDRAGRLAVIGKLSAYLAHEIRNPLSSVKMNLQRLQRWQRQGEIPERFGSAIEISLSEVGRLSSAVSNILQLSPGKPRPSEPISIHELVTESGQLLEADFLRRQVTFRWDLSAGADRVMGHPGPLKGVVINLMLNALDAQPEGGELLVRSSLRPSGPGKGGPWLELRFRDQGPGIPPHVAPRIFEPFFTTKEGGSGIGLAVAAQTVRDHGGDLYLEERRSTTEGAEFVVVLPLAPVSSEGGGEDLRPQLPPWMGDAPDGA